MQQDKAIAMRDLINEAFKTFNALINSKTRDSINLEDAKIRFTLKQFEEYYDAFIKELNSNILEYKNYRIITEYINTIFKDFNYNQAHSINYYSDILNKNYEISFLTGLKNLHHLYYYKIADFIVDRYQNGKNCQLYKHFEFIIETNTKSKLKPEKSDNFNFNYLITNYNSVEDNLKWIKLIYDEIYEFKRWQIEFDEKIETENGIRYKYSDEYYPNFEELCNLELERMHKKLEILRQEDELFSPPVINTSENKKPPYRWNSSDTDLLELITALFHSNAIKRNDNKKITRKELMIYFQEIFDMELKHPESKLSRTSDRKKTLTPYLDKLKNTFENYVEEKDDRQRERR